MDVNAMKPRKKKRWNQKYAKQFFDRQLTNHRTDCIDQWAAAKSQIPFKNDGTSKQNGQKRKPSTNYSIQDFM